MNDNRKLIGIYPTVECCSTFKLGHATLLKVLNKDGLYKNHLFTREPIDS